MEVSLSLLLIEIAYFLDEFVDFVVESNTSPRVSTLLMPHDNERGNT